MSPSTLLSETSLKVVSRALSSMLADRFGGIVGLPPSVLLDLQDSATMDVSVTQRIIDGGRCCWAHRWCTFLMVSILLSGWPHLQANW